MSEAFIENERVLETLSKVIADEIEPIDIDSEENYGENERRVQDIPGSANNKESNEETESEELQNPPEETTKEEWVDILGSGAIMKKIIKEGQPDSRPQRIEICRINYVCFLEDETLIDSASDFELQLGESDVIQGLDVSLGLMNLYEKCRLKIEPRLAYGKKGLPPNIPSDAVVIYDVELIAVKQEEDLETLTIEQRKLKGNKKRERGNWWYTRGENNLAIQCYRRALDYLDEVEGGFTGPLGENGVKQEVTDADLQNLLEDRVSVCNNMAAAQLKMEMYEAALNSLQTVLRCQPNNVKAHFRKAKVYLGKNDLSAAMKWLQKARDLSPNDVEIQREITTVAKLLEKQKVTEREVARRMFNGPKKTNTDAKNKSGKSKVRFWTTIGAVLAVGVAGCVAYRFK
ncbi:hypothetical protein JTB14_008234 [Gonioctena quinquepunctata]|nr:hypothetical protein JTB14_008234 [Gonioctena quinquepunctata]